MTAIHLLILMFTAAMPPFATGGSSIDNHPVTAMRATGIGQSSPRHAPAQVRLMARRAAEVRAVHQLGRQLGAGDRFVIHGFRYESYHLNRDGRAEVTVVFPRPRVSR